MWNSTAKSHKVLECELPGRGFWEPHIEQIKKIFLGLEGWQELRNLKFGFLYTYKKVLNSFSILYQIILQIKTSEFSSSKKLKRIVSSVNS